MTSCKENPLSLFVHEVAVENVDGMRTTYNTPTPYRPGTLTAAIDGRTVSVEALGGTTVQFDEAPQLGTVVSFFYMQA